MILFEDKDVIVCHKPAGIPVQSARLGQKDMVSILNNHLAEKRMEVQSQTGAKQGQKRMEQSTQEAVYVVHRLDQPVEGVIVFAKNQKAAANLTKQIQENQMQKIYQAVCCVDKSSESEKTEGKCGKLSEKIDAVRITAANSLQTKSDEKKQRIHLEDYMVKDGRTNCSRIAKKGEKDARLAVLDYEILAENGQYKLVQVYLKTGRHHQIRVQLAYAGLPLYGDQKYNTQWESFKLEEKARLALCAVSLSFRHPVSGKKMTFEVEPENTAYRMCLGE